MPQKYIFSVLLLAVYLIFHYTSANKDTIAVFPKYLKVGANLSSIRFPTQNTYIVQRFEEICVCFNNTITPFSKT